jgi:hypothetical protein
LTLQNGIIHAGRAFLWTDTALFHHETGERIGEVPKAFYGQLWPWAAVHSGLIDLSDPHKVARLVSEQWPLSPEYLIRAAQDALKAEAKAGRPGRLLLAWCHPDEPDEPRLFIVASDPLPSQKPYEPRELGAYMCGGADAPWRDQFDANNNLTPADMRRLIDLQIEHPTTTVQGWQGRFIGGNIVEIEVSTAGVESRVLRAVEREVA